MVTSLMAGPVELTRSETGMLGIWSGLYRLDWTEEISISLVSSEELSRKSKISCS